MRVSYSRRLVAASPQRRRGRRATRRWYVRTAGDGSQASRRSVGSVWRVSSAARMRLVQHKKEAYWFYRFLSLGYDNWVNPLFWTARDARAGAGRRAARPPRPRDARRGRRHRLHDRGDRGPRRAGARDDAGPEPAPARPSRPRPGLAACRRLLGDAEALPFADDAFDRYVSAGSIEYWPDPQRGIAEAYRVLRPGGVGVVDRPGAAGGRSPARWPTCGCCSPSRSEYRAWFERAGFDDVALHPVAPDWYRDRRVPYAVAVAGTKRAPGRRRSRSRRPPRICGRRSASAAARASRRASPPGRWRASRSSRSLFVMTLRARLERR